VNETPIAFDPEDIAYCTDLVRRQDPDRFAAAMLAPDTARPAVLTLLAVNQEIAKTREVVSEPTIGLIRLQWWRDALAEAAAGRPRRHQVVAPLAATLAAHGTVPDKVEALIAARERDLEPEPFADLSALIDYAQSTNGVLHDLLADVLGVGPDDAATRSAIADGAVAWALTGIVRAVPHALAEGGVALPDNLLKEQALSIQKLKDHPLDRRIRPVIRLIVGEARERLAGVGARVDDIAATLLALNRLTRIYLDRLAAADHDPYDARVQAPIPFAGIRMAWAKVRGRY